MKYVPKLQGGGFFVPTFFVDQMPTPPARSQSQAATKEAAPSSILDEATYKELMKGDVGLVNDVNEFVENLISLEASSSLPFMQTQNRAVGLRLIGEVNRLKRAKDDWKEAITTAQASGGYNEVAIGTSGNVYSKDKEGKVHETSLDLYKKNPKGTLLTVAELMNERQFNPQLTRQNNVFNVASNAVGLTQINDKIKGIIAALGTDTEKVQQFFTQPQVKNLVGVKPTEAEIASLNTLNSLLSAPGSFDQLTTEVATERKHVDKALNYIWNTLKVSEQRKLQATAVLNGVANPKSFIMDMLETQTDESVKQEHKLDLAPGVSTSKGAEATTSISENEAFLSGKFNTGDVYRWNDPSTGKTLVMPSTGSLTVKVGDKPFRIGTLNQFTATNFSQYLDVNKATFAGKPINLSDADKIVLQGDLHRVLMPTNDDGTPNLYFLKKFQDAKAEVDKQPNLTPAEINALYHDRGLGTIIQVDENRQLIETNNLRPYAIATGFTTTKATAATDNPNTQVLIGAEKKDAESKLDLVYKEAKVSPPTGMFADYVKGIIAFPIPTTAGISAAVNRGNVYMPKETVGDIRSNLDAFTQGQNVPTNMAQVLKTPQ